MPKWDVHIDYCLSLPCHTFHLTKFRFSWFATFVNILRHCTGQAYPRLHLWCYNAAVALLFRHIALRITKGNRPVRSIRQLHQGLGRIWPGREGNDQLMQNDMQNGACRRPFWDNLDENEQNVEPTRMPDWQSSRDTDNDE